MPVLILLNGPPASGKSTLAARYVESRPLALNLDVDVIRAMLGNWIADPTAAGLAARELAMSMARVHLAAELDVIVPQFVGRPMFILQLATVAEESGASFKEVALMMSKSAAVAAFEERRMHPAYQSHKDAAALVDRSETPEPLELMYDSFISTIGARHATVRVNVVRDDIEATMRRLETAISAAT